ncbi:Protein-glutamate methylesterase [Candidatus Methylobacter favarea]|uniref:protein-glutamate methylesterase n=1 Tax=Candidatus Methylobacter favarea TaxID=2707345 RepID=A0A8S0WXK8_9GAMM|nr:chemotaxis protein CheB [Candidatus Methylobacter favarea]CAA9888927.1 Protein-glutamate methylesterase [Candidatus Methylobacter favarea]
MTARDIVVIGASAGGIQPLIELIQSLPEDFSGYIFIVVHIPPHSPSQLPEILTCSGSLKAVHPKDGEKLKQGMIYIAPPDHHLLLEHDHAVVRKGPKENRFRPSIDALFRSAAYEFGPRVIGVVLSGLLNDGTSGLWSVKRMNGIAIIQDPNDADHDSMPVSVLEYVDVDYSVPKEEIGPLIVGLMKEKISKKAAISKSEKKLLQMEVKIALEDNAFEKGILDMGELTTFTCPECHGALVRLLEGKIIRFRCHTGHAYTASALLSGITESVENTLWETMRGMEEAILLLNKMAEQFTKAGQLSDAELFKKKADMTAEKARIIHESVFSQELLSEDKIVKKPENIKKSKHKKHKQNNKSDRA